MKRIILLIAAVLMLSSCAANYDVGPDMVGLAINQSNAEAECMKAYAESNKVDCTGMDSRDCAMVKMQQQTAAIVASATGKIASPCGTGTNLFDVMNREVAEKNATARSAIGTAGSVVKMGAMVWGATEVVDSIGKNAGSNTYGDNSDISISRTESVSSTRATNAGDGSASTGSPTGFTDVPITPTSVDALPPITP